MNSFLRSVMAMTFLAIAPAALLGTTRANASIRTAPPKCWTLLQYSGGSPQIICFDPCVGLTECYMISGNIPGIGSAESCSCTTYHLAPICCDLWVEKYGGGGVRAYGQCGGVCPGSGSCTMVTDGEPAGEAGYWTECQ